MQSREAREQQRLQQLADQCTFRPSVGTGSDGGRPRRSSSAGPRSRSSAAGRSGGIGGAAGAAAAAAAAGAVAASYASTVAAGASGGCRRSTGGFGFEARSKAFQDAKEQRLNRLREEKVRHELKEATFTPIIGFGSGGSLRKRDAAAAVAAAAAAVVPVLGLGAVPGATAEGASAQAVDRSAAEKRASSVSSGDLGMAQKKEAPSKANDGPVSFKVCAVHTVSIMQLQHVRDFHLSDLVGCLFDCLSFVNDFAVIVKRVSCVLFFSSCQLLAFSFYGCVGENKVFSPSVICWFIK